MITGRLAPSPTGGLHLGHARTFFVAWLSARSANGRMILRIEDLDAGRVRPGAAEQAMTDLRWLGLDWDDGPYVQSERLAAYKISLERLVSLEMVYPCTCTRADIARAASAPHLDDEGPTYPGTCSTRSASDGAKFGDRPFAWRFRVPDQEVRWEDLVQGPLALNPQRLGGDFIVARSGVGPSYQLAVVHDDATMGVNQVIRGDDLIPSTPRQFLLYQALGWTPPVFGHVALTFGPDGKRLAKRDNAIKLATLRETGVDPGRVLGAIVRSLGWSDRIEPSRPADWILGFRIEEIPRIGWTISTELMEELTS